MQNILENISIEVVCALITAGGTILSAIIARFTAKGTAKREIEKMKLQWKRDDDVAARKAFSEMTAAVSQYAQSGWSRHQREAAAKILIIQANARGDLSDVLDSLYLSVISGSMEEINQHLSTVMRLRSGRPDCKQ